MREKGGQRAGALRAPSLEKKPAAPHPRPAAAPGTAPTMDLSPNQRPPNVPLTSPHPPTLPNTPKNAKSFGFDNGISGGVIAHKGFAARFFPHTLSLPETASPWCKFDDHLLQLFTSCLFLAGAVAAMAGSWTSRRYGRKTTMTLAGACFLVGTVLVAAAMHIAMLIIGESRMACGCLTCFWAERYG